MTLGIRILVILSMHRKQITQYIGGHLLAVHQPVFFLEAEGQHKNRKLSNRCRIDVHNGWCGSCIISHRNLLKFKSPHIHYTCPPVENGNFIKYFANDNKVGSLR